MHCGTIVLQKFKPYLLVSNNESTTLQSLTDEEKVPNSGELRYSPNVSTTPITAMGCRQCFPLSVVQLKGKHCQKLHCRNGVVDTFGLSDLFGELEMK